MLTQGVCLEGIITRLFPTNEWWGHAHTPEHTEIRQKPHLALSHTRKKLSEEPLLHQLQGPQSSPLSH